MAALVTGAGRRIGRALALAFASAGHDVAVHHRPASREEALQVADEIRSLGRRAVALPAELTEEADVRTLVSRATEAIGTLTVLVNNASLFQDDRFGALSRERWDAHLETNLRAPIVLSEAFAAALPRDISNGEAAIVNILDQRVLKPNPQFFSYGLSRSALLAATRTMAQALAPRIRVNAVGPGPTFVSIHQDAETFAAEASGTLLGQAIRVQDICEAALYLAGARAVTGQLIAVDGGQHLGWKTPDIVDD
jgi:NAD(P)-dependent dehydrogenase (short-subunit alcohol dehydrogenase family)